MRCRGTHRDSALRRHLACYALTFTTRAIDPRAERYLAWSDDGAVLLVAQGLHKSLPSWARRSRPARIR